MRYFNNHGGAMLAALAILLMAGLIGIAAINSSDTDMTIAGNYESEIQSFYIAEAGIEMAYAVLRDTVTWRTGFNEHPFAGGEFDVTLVDSATQGGLDDTVIVTAEGRHDGAVTRIEVRFASSRPFGWAAFGDDYMRVCGTSMTDSFDSDSGSYAATRMNVMGNIGSNGQVDICGTADVGGDALSATPGGMDISGSPTVSGDTSTSAPPLILDPITDAEMNYALANTAAPAGLSGDFTYNPGNHNLRVNPGQTLTLADGVYYFNEIDIKGTIQVAPGAQVEMYLADDADIGAQADINVNGKPADLMIFSRGEDIRIQGGAEFWAVVYAPDTDIRLAGGVDLYGAFLGNVADDVGGSSFHYDRSLGDLELGNRLMKVSWREII